jgi:uncharacterized protein YndB with AHSA1/START domain
MVVLNAVEQCLDVSGDACDQINHAACVENESLTRNQKVSYHLDAIGHEFTLHTPFGPVPCKVLEVDPPNRLSFAWDEFGWRLSFELKEIDGKTQFTLIHSGWGEPDEVNPRVPEKQSVIRDRMNHGWENIVNEKLCKVVEA